MNNALQSAKFEQAALNTKNVWYAIRSSAFMPESWYSFIVFSVLMALLFILIIFFHHNSIQRRVKKVSRCYKDKQRKLMSGRYIVTATNGQKEPMYRVSYDLAKKQSTVECACEQDPNGQNVANTFRDIKVYNLNTNKVNIIPEKYCQCKTGFGEDLAASVYFTGHPSLVRFMNSGDDSFFTS